MLNNMDRSGGMTKRVSIKLPYLSLTLAVVTLCGVDSLSMRVEPEVVEEGGKVTLSCTETNFHVGALLHWKKYLHPSGNTPGVQPDALDKDWESVSLAINNHVTISHRVKADIQTINVTSYIFRLNISDVRPSDNGFYACELTQGSASNPLTVGKLTVLTPVKTVNITAVKNGVEERVSNLDRTVPSFEFSENSEASIRCEASGGNPVPVLNIRLGEDDLWAATSANNRVENVSRNYEIVENVGDIRGTELTYTVTKEVKLNISHDHLKKKISCLSSIEQLVDKHVKTEFIVDLDTESFRPRFSDCEEELLAYYGQKEVAYVCTYTADPPVNKAYVEWSAKYSQNNTIPHRVELTQSGNNVDGKYFARLSSDSGKTQIEFVFMRVTMQMFGEYQVVLENTIGKSWRTFEMKRDPSYDNSSTCNTASIVTTITACLMLKFASQIFYNL